ncbi:MAG: Gfo/Idh/MocA family protein [Candidatus Doudnabacteria bacterium]
MAARLSAALVGTGFIAAVHVDALRRLGVDVLGVVGSSPDRAAEAGLGNVYGSLGELLEDDRIDVLHLTTPNHLHYPQVKQALAAGKHVVCEKPLALTAAESRELVELADAAGVVHCTNFMARFYPLVQQARSLLHEGSLGEIWNVHGSYLQDWLLRPTDWNWRLEPERGGELRAIGDIGSHWLDLVQFVTGSRIVEVFADLQTVIPIRRRPFGPVQTFAQTEAEGEDVAIATEDLAHVLLRFEGGARGAVVISQVSAGRKNMLSFELDGADAALAWNSERPEEFWLGRRDRPNELLLRDPSLMKPAARETTTLPGGHAEGFAETFRELYRRVYRAVESGGPPPEPDYPTFADGHWENVLGEAIALSSRERRWIEVEVDG